MARRRAKKRMPDAPSNRAASGASKTSGGGRAPKSMVIRMGAGEVGHSVSQLVKDVRRTMEPGTASRLKERRSNRLRDYTTMAGPLGVTHLLLFSRSSSGNINLRIALTPRGPTLSFRIDRYSLCKDVQKALKHPRGGGKEYQTAPLLVMNNFQSPTLPEGQQPAVPKHLESLTTTVFQSLFPPIAPQSVPLSSIRRVLLLNREQPKAKDGKKPQTSEGSYVIDFRHYAILTKRTGLPRSIRRIHAAEKLIKDGRGKGGMPNLGRLQDVSEYILDPSAAASGFTSGSESEVETDAEVEVLERKATKVLNKKKLDEQRNLERKPAAGPQVEKRAVKLIELGPRLKLHLVKVEEGVCEGKVMWHDFLSKTRKEEKELDKVWNERRKLKEERKRIQRENVERKRKEKGEGAEGADAAMEDDDEWDSEDFMDDNDEDGKNGEDAMEVET